MNDLLFWLQRFFNGLFHEVTSFSLTGVLWLGLFALTIALVVLMRTRWGHSKPVLKCVALSVLAHVLLGGCAYGTRLVMTIPRHQPSDHVALRVIRESDTHDTPSVNGLAAAKWDQFELPSSSQPTSDPAARPQPVLAQTASRTELANSTRFAGATITRPVSPEEQLPVPANLEALVTAHRVGQNDVEASPISRPTAMRAEEPAPAGPKASTVARPELASSAQDYVPGPPPAHVTADPAELAERLGKSVLQEAELEWEARIPDSVFAQKVTETSRATPHPAAKLRLGDAKELPRVYSLRSADLRDQIVNEVGGSQKTEQAVAAALQWLSANQEPDGRWNAARFGAGQEHLVYGHDRRGAGARADNGITALSLLAFLAAGHSHLEGEHSKAVQKGLEFLLASQQSNGSLAGEASLFAQMYCHAMASLAISEALAVTGDERLLAAVERAVSYSVMSQNQSDGGWRYQPGDQGDMSQFGWQVMALTSAELGGITVPDRTKQLMVHFLKRCSSGTAGGLAGYRPGHPPSATMTAEALACRYFLNEPISEATLLEASNALMRDLPRDSEVNFYYWYYGTLALFQGQGSAFTQWNEHLTATLLSSQRTTGSLAGSWDPNGVWCGYGGRVFSTAMAALCLEVYYRYLPE